MKIRTQRVQNLVAHNVMMTWTTLRVDENFGAAVKRVFRDRGGLSLEQARLRTGIDHQTLNRMKKGEIPKLDKIEAFARGFGLDVNEWRELAGYGRLDPSPEQAAEVLLEAAEQVELDEDAVDVAGFRGAESMTENDRRRINAALRLLIAADRKRRGITEN